VFELHTVVAAAA